MAAPTGQIILMGSGELTATMVAVHKEALSKLPQGARAVFVDTPAGFQPNADQISRRAAAYFERNVGHPLEIASLKAPLEVSLEQLSPALEKLDRADFIFLGPGSPSYLLRQLQNGPVDRIIRRRLAAGACLVVASAAALTVGRFALPVYELYKVGEALHWKQGFDFLGDFDIDAVVVAHWNNAEGGSHDTRYCYMGRQRFDRLLQLLPENQAIIGLDEHTACCIDLNSRFGSVRGIGHVTVCKGDLKRKLGPKERFDMRLQSSGDELASTVSRPPSNPNESAVADFWQQVRHHETLCQTCTQNGQVLGATRALLELDRLIWQAHQQQEDPEQISQAREVFRESMALLGHRMDRLPASTRQCLKPLVEQLLALRDVYKSRQQYRMADDLRQGLDQAGVIVEDTPQGPRWRLKVPADHSQ